MFASFNSSPLIRLPPFGYFVRREYRIFSGKSRDQLIKRFSPALRKHLGCRGMPPDLARLKRIITVIKRVRVISSTCTCPVTRKVGNENRAQGALVPEFPSFRFVSLASSFASSLPSLLSRVYDAFDNSRDVID